MITEKDVLNWVEAHVCDRIKNGFPDQVDDITSAYILGLYEGYYSAIIEYGNTEVEVPEESCKIKEI